MSGPNGCIVHGRASDELDADGRCPECAPSGWAAARARMASERAADAIAPVHLAQVAGAPKPDDCIYRYEVADAISEAHAAGRAEALDRERLIDAIADALPVPTMLDMDFAEDTADAILAALDASNERGGAAGRAEEIDRDVKDRLARAHHAETKGDGA